MSLYIKMNKWAPKLTIIFQLTIWSIVGIILLQKGAISLCERTKAQNDTINIQEKFTTWNEDKLFTEINITENRLKIINFRIESQRKNVTIDHSNTTSKKQWPRDLYTSHTTSSIGNGISKIISMIKDQTAIRHDYEARNVYAIQTSSIHSNNKNEVEKINHKKNVIIPLAFNEDSYGRENTMINNSTSSVSFEFKDFGSTNFIRLNERNLFEHENNEISYKDVGNNKSETKSQRLPINRVGTAIAIIMLAIGVVMLLLGPLIIIIRTFNNRRRTRKILKSRCYNDQPPTYEEATLMDQAPKYSTLHLDKILDSS
ncbi:hypothetical protein WN48_03825, partial [Eufriesea mexicana]